MFQLLTFLPLPTCADTVGQWGPAFFHVSLRGHRRPRRTAGEVRKALPLASVDSECMMKLDAVPMLANTRCTAAKKIGSTAYAP